MSSIRLDLIKKGCPIKAAFFDLIQAQPYKEAGVSIGRLR